MIENIEYTEEDGTITKNTVTVYALSTCGFCRRSMEFLRENSIKFRYIYMDKLEYAVKKEAKAELKEKFDKRVVFPFAVINDEKALVGFQKLEWTNTLLE